MAKILNELEKDLDFKIIELFNEKSLVNEIKNLKNYLIITQRKNLNIKNEFIINKLPIRIFKFIEQLNIEFLKLNFSEQSQIKFGNYSINLNSREIFSNNLKIKLTEKEVNTIIYLSKANKPISIDELQSKVWGYYSDIETHTVETHIYRLRKKVSNIFQDENFIISDNSGYRLSKKSDLI